jgi:hypothetical protein
VSNSNSFDSDGFINEEQLEKLLALNRGALRRRRHRGFDLPMVKLGKSIRYHWPTVRDFLLNQSNPTPLPAHTPAHPTEIDGQKRRGRKRKSALTQGTLSILQPSP